VGLAVAHEDLVDTVVLVELDDRVAAVWRTILGSQADDLADLILSFDLTRQNVLSLLEQRSQSELERAFATIVRNRVSHGGGLGPGSGLLRRGENGNGLHSRWYPQTLALRIQTISDMRNRIAFVQRDGMEVIEDNVDCTDTLFFIDPPYTASDSGPGRRLYVHSELDHRSLFELASDISGGFLMTYNDDPRVRSLVEEFGMEALPVPMCNRHHQHVSELLISRDMSWLSS